MYKGKGNKSECSDSRTGLLSILGKEHGRVVIEKMVACTKLLIREKQCGLIKER